MESKFIKRVILSHQLTCNDSHNLNIQNNLYCKNNMLTFIMDRHTN